MNNEVRRYVLWPSLAAWVLLVGGLAYTLFLREYALSQVEVPCRASDGRVWAYQFSPDGAWAASRHEIGEEPQRMWRNAEAPKSLDCDPRNITRGDLDQLENGVVESVVLAENGGTWTFVLRDELRGIFTYRYRFLDGHVTPTAATRKMINLPAYGAFWVITFSGLALLIRRARSASHLRPKS